MSFNEVGRYSYHHVFTTNHTNALGLCTGEASILRSDSVKSGWVGSSQCFQSRGWPGLAWVFTHAYQFSGLKLAFYLATFAPSWLVLKHLLAMAFFFFNIQRQWVGEDCSHSSHPRLPQSAMTLRCLRDPGTLQDTEILWRAGKADCLSPWVFLSLCCHCVTFPNLFLPF